MNHPPLGTDDGQMPVGCLEGGGGCWSFELITDGIIIYGCVFLVWEIPGVQWISFWYAAGEVKLFKIQPSWPSCPTGQLISVLFQAKEDFFRDCIDLSKLRKEGRTQDIYANWQQLLCQVCRSCKNSLEYRRDSLIRGHVNMEETLFSISVSGIPLKNMSKSKLLQPC